MQTKILPESFQQYPTEQAPFMHRQLREWENQKPLKSLKVLHHVPVVQNTLLKIACLVAGGAEVVVTNPSFVNPCNIAIQRLKNAQIEYAPNLKQLQNKKFDIFFDCGAELFQVLGAPTMGSVELTGTGDIFYREVALTFPVISIDRSQTKQLETIFGIAKSAVRSLEQLKGKGIYKQSWLIFGFGKIGRGLAYSCYQNGIPVIIAETNFDALEAAKKLNIPTVNALDFPSLENALKQSDIVITATGKASVLSCYPEIWFKDKILANMGVLDEIGDNFKPEQVLNEGRPLNFILTDPTPIEYIDPEFYIHNEAAKELLSSRANAWDPSLVQNVSPLLDKKIIHDWCQFHRQPSTDMETWFIKY